MVLPLIAGMAAAGAANALLSDNDINFEAHNNQMQTQRGDRYIGNQRGAAERMQDTEEMLRLRALGQGPSVAVQQAGIERDNAIAAASSQAASARGGNIALAQRMAANNQAQAVQGAGRTAALGRAQEQAAASGQLMGAQQMGAQQYNTIRGQELDIAGQNLSSANQAQALNMQRAIAEQQANQSGMLGAMGLGAGVMGASSPSDVKAKEGIRPLAALTAQEEEDLARWDESGSLPDRTPERAQPERAQPVRTVQPAQTPAPYQYQYKPPVARRLADELAEKAYQEFRKPRAGVMAQDLE